MLDSPAISVVINHYNPAENERLDSICIAAIRSLRCHTSRQLEVILSDGSGLINKTIADEVEKDGGLYLSSDNGIDFAETYNRGMEATSSDLVAAMANDILVSEKWDDLLISEMQRTGASMGCPYLSFCDYFSQVRSYVLSPVTFRPTMMTFNLNLAPKSVWDNVGPIEKSLSGCYNDIDYMLRMREQAMSVIVADAGNVVHVGRAAMKASTTVSLRRDTKSFLEKYPCFSGRDPSLRVRTEMIRNTIGRAAFGWLANAKYWRLQRVRMMYDRLGSV